MERERRWQTLYQNMYSQDKILNKIKTCNTNYLNENILTIKSQIQKNGFSTSALSDYQTITNTISLFGKEALERHSEININHLCEVAQCYQEEFKEKNIVEYKGSLFTEISLFFSTLFKEGFRAALSVTYLRVQKLNSFSEIMKKTQFNAVMNEMEQESHVISITVKELDRLIKENGIKEFFSLLIKDRDDKKYKIYMNEDEPSFIELNENGYEDYLTEDMKKSCQNGAEKYHKFIVGDS